MPTLKDAIQNKNKPDMYAIERLLQLEKEFESKIEKILKDAKDRIDRAIEESVFLNLEPAKKIAKATVEEEIRETKKEVRDRTTSVLESVKAFKEETVAKVQAECDGLMESLTLECSEMVGEKMRDIQRYVDSMTIKCEGLFQSYEAKLEVMRGPEGKPGKDADEKAIEDRLREKVKDGKDGKDGSPDTPTQIADKLNTLSEKVEISVIKGLPAFIKNFQRALKEKGGGSGSGGGGMSNIQHETKNVSSATTQITTTYPIAMGGFAIFGAHYQGQLIMRGEHYTVNADRKTLPLTFTPDDNTKIDIIYMRG